MRRVVLLDKLPLLHDSLHLTCRSNIRLVRSTTFSCLFLGTEVKFQFLVGGAIILVSVWAFSNHAKAAVMIQC